MRGIPNNAVPCRACPSPYASPKDDLCGICRLKAIRQRTAYQWTPEADAMLRRAYENSRSKADLSSALTYLVQRTGIPKHSLRDRAVLKGWCVPVFPRRLWTAEEDAYLRDRAGTVSCEMMARHLHRRWNAVAMRIFKLGLSQRVMEGYSARDLAYCLGVGEGTVSKWEGLGWLRRHGGRYREDAVKNFLIAHSEQYDLHRVDQAWFKGLVFLKFNRSRLFTAEEERVSA